MNNILQDLNYAFRVLRKNPGFALGAIIVLALGIGANSAIFSVVDAVLLRPLPYTDAERIAMVYHVPPQKSFPGMKIFAVSPANYLDWKSQSSAFDALSIFHGTTMTVTGKDQPEAMPGIVVSSEFFQVFGAAPIIGRTFTPEEDADGHGHVVVLSYPFWQNYFGADPNVIGKSIAFNGQPYSIIGVMPERFHFPDQGEYFVPLGWTDKERAVRNNHNYLVIARLKRGVGLQQAPRARISRRRQRLGGDDRTATRGPRRGRAPRASRFARCSRVRTSHRVRQCSQPGAREDARTAQGNCNPYGARSWLAARDAADACRNAAPRGSWRRARIAGGARRN